MIDDCIFEIWNYKYNQLTPCQILEKADSKFVRLHCYAVTKVNKETGEREIVEFDSFTFLQAVKNRGEWDFDILKLFSPGSMLWVRGFDIIVDKAEYDKEGNIRLFFKYIECDEETEREVKEKFPAWSWINSYGAQWKKVNAGYNFITLRPDDRILFRSFTPSRLMEERIRKDWYFSDPIDKEVVIGMERRLGYIRPDGKTWMEYFWGATEGKQYGVKVKDDGNLILIDSTDPKNPIQAVKESEIEKFIEGVKEYAER